MPAAFQHEYVKLLQGKNVKDFTNKKDLAEIPDEIRKKMHFYPVKDMDEIVSLAFAKPTGEVSGKKQATKSK
jgi:ATP-dependent Lon protease